MELEGSLNVYVFIVCVLGVTLVSLLEILKSVFIMRVFFSVYEYMQRIHPETLFTVSQIKRRSSTE